MTVPLSERGISPITPEQPKLSGVIAARDLTPAHFEVIAKWTGGNYTRQYKYQHLIDTDTFKIEKSDVISYDGGTLSVRKVEDSEVGRLPSNAREVVLERKSGKLPEYEEAEAGKSYKVTAKDPQFVLSDDESVLLIRPPDQRTHTVQLTTIAGGKDIFSIVYQPLGELTGDVRRAAEMARVAAGSQRDMLSSGRK